MSNFLIRTFKSETWRKNALSVLRSYLNSYWFYVLQILVAAFFVWLRQEVLGAVVFGILLGAILVICNDIRATTLPFLIISTITTNRYDSYDTYIVFVKYIPIALACLVYHFLIYRNRFVVGESAKGIFAVSVAICFSGMGRFTFMDYVYGSYYFFGLGFAMLIVYALMRSQFDDDKEEYRMKFAFLMTMMGVLCGFMIANGYYRLYVDKSISVLQHEGFSQNNLATILMLAMPFPLYLARKNRFIAFGSVAMLGFLVLTRSRGGLLFGCVEFCVCAALWVFSALTKRRRKIRLFICLGALLAAVCALLPFIIEMVLPRFGGDITNESRYKMLWEGLRKFVKRPLSGYGLLDNDLNYEGMRKKGALTWYHMMPMQIIGGMGLIGVFCYGYQMFGRIKLILTKKNRWSLVLGISYLGILMMSCVNPGEFCPLPFELLTVMLFIFQEVRLQTSRPLYRDVRQKGIC
ncbi:MAG: O-antigen ligase family protein [Candidatus Borkfalkiaceae bacterium]|nr:O-antigen ligase family protein [Clostridia bacterium]MDY6223470.1 O-antigen ligase family protein [Christensenellaceae bacterium]